MKQIMEEDRNAQSHMENWQKTNRLKTHFYCSPCQIFSSLMNRRSYSHKGDVRGLTLALAGSVISMMEMKTPQNNLMVWAKHLQLTQTNTEQTHTDSVNIEQFCHIKI